MAAAVLGGCAISFPNTKTITPNYALIERQQQEQLAQARAAGETRLRQVQAEADLGLARAYRDHSADSCEERAAFKAVAAKVATDDEGFVSPDEPIVQLGMAIRDNPLGTFDQCNEDRRVLEAKIHAQIEARIKAERLAARQAAEAKERDRLAALAQQAAPPPPKPNGNGPATSGKGKSKYPHAPTKFILGGAAAAFILPIFSKEGRQHYFRNLKNASPEILLGFVTSASVKWTIGAAALAKSTAVGASATALLAHFGIAALAVTVPPAAIAAIGAVAVAGLAGGLSGVVRAWYRNKKNGRPLFFKQSGYGQAFVKGMAFGAAGGAIGFGVADLVSSDWAHEHLWDKAGQFFHAHNPFAGTQAPVEPAPPPHGPDPVQAPPPAPAPPPHGPDPVQAPPPAPVPPPHGPDPVQAPPPAPVPPPHGPDPVQAPPPAPCLDAHAILTDKQLHSLPRSLQSLAASQDPKDLLRFAKDASFDLINNSHNNPESIKAGVKMLEEALKFADAQNIHTPIVESMDRDLAYMKAWGHGTEQDIEGARRLLTAAGKYGKGILIPASAPN